MKSGEVQPRDDVMTGGDDDHRERPRHPEREHHLLQPGRQLRTGGFAPVAGTNGRYKRRAYACICCWMGKSARDPERVAHGRKAIEVDTASVGFKIAIAISKSAGPAPSSGRAAVRPHRVGRRALPSASGERGPPRACRRRTPGGQPRPAAGVPSGARLCAGPEAADRSLSPPELIRRQYLLDDFREELHHSNGCRSRLSTRAAEQGRRDALQLQTNTPRKAR